MWSRRRAPDNKRAAAFCTDFNVLFDCHIWRAVMGEGVTPE